MPAGKLTRTTSKSNKQKLAAASATAVVDAEPIILHAVRQPGQDFVVTIARGRQRPVRPAGRSS